LPSKLGIVVEENRVKDVVDQFRRRLLKNVALGMALVPLAVAPLTAANAADAPLVAADDPLGKALKYVGDSSKSADAKPGSTCTNCKLYQGAGSVQGGCLLFPGKSVKSAGWCISWTALAAALGLDDAVPVGVARNTGSNGLRIRQFDGQVPVLERV
jgi:hypothetical protein